MCDYYSAPPAPAARARTGTRPAIRPLALAVATALVAAAVMLASAPGVRAWGDEGHRAVASIAYSRLSPRARVRVDALLAAHPFKDIESAAVWPDGAVKRSRPDTAQWHYVNGHDKPLSGKCEFRYPRDCRDGVCALTAVGHAVATLRLWVTSPERVPPALAAEALAFAVHIVGDLAQPLHASGFARGGNDVPVTFAGHPTNLHAVWDFSLLRKTVAADFGGSWPAWLAQLVGGAAVSTLDTGDVACAATVAADDARAVAACAARWAKQANRIVCRDVFPAGFAPGAETSGAYWAATKAVVHDQLVRGGLRLAAMLNQALE
ncbi:hypothetical protein H9P43_000076 [Blastocladiella emersonii ATCC 22665]|nr:hypothetical protein H9P43_000076 [Blastocladiella emersonii ATCC 22665]